MRRVLSNLELAVAWTTARFWCFYYSNNNIEYPRAEVFHQKVESTDELHLPETQPVLQELCLFIYQDCPPCFHLLVEHILARLLLYCSYEQPGLQRDTTRLATLEALSKAAVLVRRDDHR